MVLVVQPPRCRSRTVEAGTSFQVSILPPCFAETELTSWLVTVTYSQPHKPGPIASGSYAKLIRGELPVGSPSPDDLYAACGRARHAFYKAARADLGVDGNVAIMVRD